MIVSGTRGGLTTSVHLGDGLAGLAQLGDDAVDHALTDPPFDTRTHRAAGERRRWQDGDRRVNGALPFAALTAEQLRDTAAQLARVVRRWILVFAAERQIETWATALEAAGARFVRVGMAVRTNPRPQMTGDRPAPAFDPIVIAHAGSSGPMRWNGGGRPARWEARAARWDTGGRTVHPTQKPVPLLRALLDDFTDPGELVVDPFAGSGSTAVACRMADRRFIGWEIESGYHATALSRIDNVREQRELALG